MEKRLIDQQLVEFVKCPKCKKGNVVHVDNYFCNNSECDFVMFREQYGLKISKLMMQNLIKNHFIEKLFTNAYLNETQVTAFLYFDQVNFKVRLIFPNKLPVANCPKCKKEHIFMKYSHNNDSFFYGCSDYKICRFTLPFNYNGKTLKFKDIKLLCNLKPVKKQLTSLKGFNYTVNLKLSNEYKLVSK